MGHVSPFGTCPSYGVASLYTRESVSRTGGMFSGMFPHTLRTSDCLLPRNRWCPTNPDYFAIAAHSIKRGAVLHVHNIGYVNAQPSIINVAPRPHRIRDFDFMALRGQPLLAIAFGQRVVVFSIGDE